MSVYVVFIVPCRMIDGCLTNSKSGDFDWRCWSACTSTYYTGPCSDPINTDQGTLFRIDSLTKSLQFSPSFSPSSFVFLIWWKSRVVMRKWHTRGGARSSHFVAARLLPRVLSRASPRLACHSKWRACSQDFVFLAFFAVHFQ